jgi:hypothetical protein
VITKVNSDNEIEELLDANGQLKLSTPTISEQPREGLDQQIGGCACRSDETVLELVVSERVHIPGQKSVNRGEFRLG